MSSKLLGTLRSSLPPHFLSSLNSLSGQNENCWLESYRIPIPPDSLLAAFEKTVSPLVQRIAAQGEESRTLATLRDTLLPKLLSGELSVAEMQDSRGGAENAEGAK